MTLFSTCSYYALSLTGYGLKTALGISDKIISFFEEPAVHIFNSLPIEELKLYLQPVVDPRLRILPKAQVHHRPKNIYQVRNEILELIQMSLNSIPITSELLHSFIHNTHSKVGVDMELLKQYHIYPSGFQTDTISFSFCDTNWLFFYQLGVAECLIDCMNPDILHSSLFIGTGTGAIVAAILALKLDIQHVQLILMNFVSELSKRPFGYISVMSENWRNQLNEIIPETVETDKLYVSLTNFESLENYSTNEFNSRDELVDGILASCYTPIVYESPIKFKNSFYINGSFSKYMPTLDGLTITVSPHKDEADICPTITKYTPIQTHFPSHDLKTLELQIVDGYKDTKRWLKKMYNTKSISNRFFKEGFPNKLL
ncbi:1-acylglycerol-3-phosphate O-acyltransferase pnpla3 [Boothiomyces sp. JEL0838]|nr:1-acylglycerol-3-phosphate O-acyltransferase pnpla3 [Boothiomyces sp. JEL0838]